MPPAVQSLVDGRSERLARARRSAISWLFPTSCRLSPAELGAAREALRAALKVVIVHADLRRAELSQSIAAHRERLTDVLWQTARLADEVRSGCARNLFVRPATHADDAGDLLGFGSPMCSHRRRQPSDELTVRRACDDDPPAARDLVGDKSVTQRATPPLPGRAVPRARAHTVPSFAPSRRSRMGSATGRTWRVSATR